MNYDKPRQREKDKRWDFTTGNRRSGVHPIGYCQGWREQWDEQDGQAWVEKLRAHKDKFHTDGHETEQEARECYKKYQLDHNVRVGKDASSQHKCKECGAWTQSFVTIGQATMIILCEDHQGEEILAKYVSGGDCWHS